MFRIQFTLPGPSRAGPRLQRCTKIALAASLSVLAAAAVAALVADLLDSRAEASPELPAGWERGFNLTAFQPNAYAEPTARRAMLTARATGARLVALAPTWYMDAADSSEIFSDPAKTPTDASILAAAHEARRLGLAVVIKPHVDVRDGTFRGDIQPADREAWFESYGRIVDRYAALAQRTGAETFVVGTELTSMSSDSAAWRALIARARGRFDGEIVFAANWVDGAEQIDFLDALDAIGIDAYMPLGDDPDPTVAELVDAWGPYVVRMDDLNERWGLPVVFTELGYESRLGTAARLEEPGAGLSQSAQANAYAAAFEALSPQPWFDGIWWWEWSAEGLGIGPGDDGFSPEGKQAALVLEDWQRG